MFLKINGGNKQQMRLDYSPDWFPEDEKVTSL